jgi:hypothetical protein
MLIAKENSLVNDFFKECRVANKVGKACANKTRMVSEHRAMEQEDGFNALKLLPARASRAAVRQPDWPFSRLQAALRLRPRRALSSAEAPQSSCHWLQRTTKTIAEASLFQF